MRYSQLENRNASEFQRLTGLKPEVFGQMMEAVESQIVESQIHVFGRPCKLSLADQLLLCLMNWPEYRTMAAIALASEVSEPTVPLTIHKIETALLLSGEFTLPGKTILRGDEIQLEVVLVDATEVPIERPRHQKNRDDAIPARRNDTR